MKIWDTGLSSSVATIDSKANVCCVKFNPSESNKIVFGSADHQIHYYDIRNLQRELFMFKGHGKAVSYVQFLDDKSIVSASTDSTLKLWSVLTILVVCVACSHGRHSTLTIARLLLVV